jgi:hypothetical protein
MGTQGHEIVHDIVTFRDTMKNVADEFGFLLRGDFLEAKVDVLLVATVTHLVCA